MRESLWKNLDKVNGIESPLEKESLWMEVFWNEYKPDYSFEEFFSWIKERYYDKGRWVLHYEMEEHDDNKMFVELFSMIKENNFKLDIQFLETLRDDQKKYISQICLYFTNYNDLCDKFEMGKSLLIWMFWRKTENYWNHYFQQDKLYEISKNFEGFNLKYFRQAYDCLSRAWDKDIYHILKEYNLIKNIDKDLESMLMKDTLDLWKWYSLWTFHIRSEDWYGYEEKYWLYELDKEWKETKIQNVWEKNAGGYKYVLDRNHESVYKDVSWISYRVYLDAPTWIALFYENNPIACMCFYIKNWNELFINQIQRVPYYEYDRYGRCIWKHYSKEVNDVDWKNILYNIVSELAKKYNVARIIIQGWDNNKWTKEMYEDYETYYFRDKFSSKEWIPPKNKGRLHLDPKIAHEIYDVFAEWLWFQKDNDWNWKINDWNWKMAA